MSIERVRAYIESLPDFGYDRNAVPASFYTELDAHRPTRASASGVLAFHTWADGTRGVIVWREDFGSEVTPATRLESVAARNLHRSVLLIDNGATVTPHYPAGWTTSTPSVIYFHPFPTNADGRTRPDNGAVVDYSGWIHAPARAYHVKVSVPMV